MVRLALPCVSSSFSVPRLSLPRSTNADLPPLSLVRAEIAALSKRGYRVICPSQTGYGESSKPDDLEAYTFKSVAYDMNGVLDQLGAGKVVVFGHDCALLLRDQDEGRMLTRFSFFLEETGGGMVAWRFCEYFPDRVLAVARYVLLTSTIGTAAHASLLDSVCTPYMPPAPLSAPYTPLEKLVRTKVPQFGYQIFFSSPDSAAKFEVPGVLEYFLAGSFSATVKEAKIKAGKKTGAMPVKEGEFEKNLDRLRVRAEKGELGEMPNDPVRPLFLPSTNPFSNSLSSHHRPGIPLLPLDLPLDRPDPPPKLVPHPHPELPRRASRLPRRVGLPVHPPGAVVDCDGGPRAAA